MPIYAFEGKRPSIPPSTYVAPSAVVIGNVIAGESCYIGPGAILRGDYGSIEIGDETAVEEGVIVHARPGDWTRIGKRVTLGHGAMVHNATIGDQAVIGMRAVISDFSEVGAGAIVGEMGLVKNGQSIPPKKVALGVPVKVVGDVDKRHYTMTHWAKDLYVNLARRYRSGALQELRSTGSEPTNSLLMAPIGTIHTPFEEATQTPIQGALARETEGEVHVDSQYKEGLADLAGFSHVVLVYAFHQSEGYCLTVTPHLDDSPRGLFSTRAPRRPNPIGITVSRLLTVEGCRIKVKGVDMLDGTPLLDVKPFVPLFDSPQDGRFGWLQPHLDELCRQEEVPLADNRFHREDDSES